MLCAQKFEFKNQMAPIFQVPEQQLKSVYGSSVPLQWTSDILEPFSDLPVDPEVNFAIEKKFEKVRENGAKLVHIMCENSRILFSSVTVYVIGHVYGFFFPIPSLAQPKSKHVQN